MPDIGIPGAQPKYATRRNPSRRTIGGRSARIAAALGKPDMPWQRYVRDVAGEIDDAGNLVYELVIVSVPRQSGKTTLVGPVHLDRLMQPRPVRTFFTAQTGGHARERFRDLAELVDKSPLAPIFQFRWPGGKEYVKAPQGSRMTCFAPSEEAVHGETPELVSLDEIWAFDEALGDAMLESAILPAQITLAGRRQVWMVSTAGTARSTFMRKWIEAGRRGEDPRIAFFEWGLPDGADPFDPDTIRAFHPAVGYTITVDDVLSLAPKQDDPDYAKKMAHYLRAACNVWIESSDPVIPLAEWDDLHNPTMKRPNVRDIAIAYELSGDGASTSVMAAWRDDEGRPCIRTLHTAPGTRWAVRYIPALVREWKPAHLAADDGGETRRLTAELRQLDLDITTPNGREFGVACSAYLAEARDGYLQHDGSQTLRRGMAALELQRVGDITKFSRRSPGSVAGPIAAAVALWAYDNAAKPLPKPLTKY